MLYFTEFAQYRSHLMLCPVMPISGTQDPDGGGVCKYCAAVCRDLNISCAFVLALAPTYDSPFPVYAIGSFGFPLPRLLPPALAPSCLKDPAWSMFHFIYQTSPLSPALFPSFF